MDKIKKIKGINNPYVKLWLVENEKVRVDALKHLATLFWTEIKTRKRPNTMVENVFYKNEWLKELLSKKTITPEENKIIHEQIESDIINLQKDLWYKTKVENSVQENIKWNIKFSWYNFYKQFKDKVTLPVWKKLKEFWVKNKFKIAWVSFVIWASVLSWYAKLAEYRDKAFDTNTVLEYQDNKPWNILDFSKTLENDDYINFVKKVWNLKVDRNSKINPNSSDFKDFDNLYWLYMSKLQKKHFGKNGFELTQEEWKTFFVMQYIATNSYIDYLKNKWDFLKWTEFDKNTYEVASYKSQLMNLEGVYYDYNDWNYSKTEWVIRSWKTYINYHINSDWSININWFEKKVYSNNN
jgi:hypothetical protein